MEGEVNNFILVWTTVIASLFYSHKVGQIFPTGIARRLAILPIICLFFFLPLNFTSINFGATTSFLIAWLANFKIMLFAFGKGPLSSNPPIPLSRFIPLACFPIKINQQSQETTTLRTISQKSKKSSLIIHVKRVILIAILLAIYNYKKNIHPKIILCLYCVYIYLALEMIMAFSAATARAVDRVELEPQFNKPHLTTSLQDFWSKRWNLMVSKILHPTVYEPVTSISACFISRKWARIPAILATFLVSGLMHELIFYTVGRLRPTGEVMCYFLLHGASLSVEIVLKKKLNGKFRVPGIISGPLTLAYVVLTSFWLFFPPFLRTQAELKLCTEYLAFIELVKNRRLVSPTDLSCPFL